MTYGGAYQIVYTVDEYNQYLATYRQSLPKDFVHLNNVPKLGSFSSFCVMKSDFPYRYVYSFCDSNGFSMNLYITHTTGKPDISIMQPSEYTEAVYTTKMKSMVSRGVKSDTETVIIREGVEYYYGVNGGLKNIVVNADGIQFKLGGQFSHRGKQYNNSICQRLFLTSTKNIISARDEIMQAVKSN
jgi:hypothetical protein